MNRNYVLTEIAISYNRKHKHPRMKELIALVNDARAYYYQHTLSWQTDGVQILPLVSFSEFTLKMHPYVNEFHNLTRSMGMITALMRLTFMPYPYTDYPYDNPLLKGLLINDERRRLYSAKCDLVKRAHVTLDKLLSKLKVTHINGVAKPRKFHDTIFLSVLEDCRLFDRLNIEECEVIDNLTKELRELASKYKPKDIRRDAALRRNVYDKVESLADSMSNA